MKEAGDAISSGGALMELGMLPPVPLWKDRRLLRSEGAERAAVTGAAHRPAEAILLAARAKPREALKSMDSMPGNETIDGSGLCFSCFPYIYER